METILTTEWTESQYLIDNDFETLAAERVRLKEEREALDARIYELNLEIGAMLATARVKSVAIGEHRFTLSYATTGGQLSRERLLEAGVTADQLARGTMPKTVGKPYIRIEVRK